MRDKINKGEYIIRATVLDRLVDNKIYYKFVEYGERIKQQKLVDKEKALRKKKGINLDNVTKQLTNIGAGGSQVEMQSLNQSSSESEDEHHKEAMNAPLFDDLEGQPKKSLGVQFAEDVALQLNPLKKRNANDQGVGPRLMTHNLHNTKIGFDNRTFDELYGGNKGERVWLDFGKGTSNVMKYDPMRSTNISYNNHKLYFMLPPKARLSPSMVVMFELVYLSGKDPSRDEVQGWGALPVVNGDFDINTGKFKVPLLYGSVDYSTNKFKDIENKFKRNVDEWLCNLYIDVKRIKMFDFRQHEEKIEFIVPKKLQRLLQQQHDRQRRIEIEREILENKGDESESDYMSSDSEDQDSGGEWDQPLEPAEYEDPKASIKYTDFRYCVNTSNEADAEKKNSLDTRKMLDTDLSFRRTLFILNEIINDLGIQKAPVLVMLGNAVLAIGLLWVRMFVHYMSQYLMLKFIDAPVTSVSFTYYKVYMEYGIWSVYQEMIVTAAGPVGNALMFLFLISLCWISQKWVYCFPVIGCKLIAWYGLLTIMDFMFICVIDLGL